MVADSGKRKKKKKTQFIVFSQPYKTPSESKKIETGLIVCWAFVGRFCCQTHGFVFFLDGAGAAEGNKNKERGGPRERFRKR